MTTALQGVRQDERLEEGVLSRVADCLEIASGEMTFQRFVRYDKAELLGILCGRGDVLKAVRYFRRQSCGTAEQLLTEATAGEIDRIAPLKGMRFPGGALDEQDALYRMLESVGSAADWPICWALLEIHQFGDSRHLERSAQAYARLAAQVGRERSALALMVERLMIICEDEFDDEQRASFISTLRDSLPSALLGSFEEVLGEAYEPTDAGLPAAAGSVAFPPDSWDSSSLEGEEQDESIRNAFVIPGMFGTSDASRESEAAVARAERHLARGNASAARDEALAALELLQHGGWSIWGNLSDSADRAEAILRHGADSTESVVKIYAPLILAERHADAWRRAAHVIRKISGIANCDERAGLVQLVVEHIEILVGKSLESTSEYEFLEVAGTQDASSSLMELLLATIDHPKWLRREKASELILWLLNTHPRYIPMLGPRAFSMESTNLPDVLCGVLDHLSMTDPSELWDQLAPALDIESIQSNCKHVGRLGVLLRISERAALRGSESAEEMLEAVRAVFPQPEEGVHDAASAQVTCPVWATTCEHEWQELTALGLMTQTFAEQAKQVLHEECAPLSIDTTVELEHLVARGVGDNSSHALGRWKAKVRYALQVALLPQAFDSLLPDIIQVFRVYNPSRMNHLRVLGFASPSRTWLDSLRNTESGGLGPARGNDIYLDFFERVWDGDRYRSVRMTAFFYRADEQPHPPGQIAGFSSTELPESRVASAQDVCARVEWRPVFFGSFTPAVPSARLIQMTNATGTDITRANWRIGRTRGAGPLNEGCFLAIKRAALRLHPGIRMAWLCEIDDKRAIISRPA